MRFCAMSAAAAWLGLGLWIGGVRVGVRARVGVGVMVDGSREEAHLLHLARGVVLFKRPLGACQVVAGRVTWLGVGVGVRVRVRVRLRIRVIRRYQ